MKNSIDLFDELMFEAQIEEAKNNKGGKEESEDVPES
jgi:hypothetical protein